MRKAFNIIGLALALLLAFSSCENEPILTFTGLKSYTFKGDGGSEIITFSSNRAWAITSTESWITFSPASGGANEGSTQVTMTCAANTTYEPRNATVTISSEGLSESFSISQETNYGLIASPSTFYLTNAEQDIDIKVQKNVQYSVAIDKEYSDWISVGGTKSLTTDQVTFHIAANTSYDDREGKITFKRIDGDLSQTVIVKQGQTNGLFVTTSEYDLSNESHNLAVEVKANVKFEVTSQADWIAFVETKAFNASTISLAIDANESYDNRTGIVIVKQTNGELTDTITINQHQTDGLFASPTEFELDNREQSVEIVVEQNVAYTVVIPDDAKSWIAVAGSSQTKALSKETVTLNITENTTYDNREASVTIKQVDGTLAETVEIKQKQCDGLILSPTTFNLTKAEQVIAIEVRKNVQYSMVIDKECSDWISPVGTKALTTDSIHIHIAANTSYSDREGKITFKQIDGDISQAVTIKQGQTDTIAVDENTYSFTSAGGTAKIKGTTNVDVIIEIPPEYSNWISAPQTKGLVDFSREIVVQPNDTYVDREATIYVTEKKSNIRQAVIIKEAQLDYVQLCDLKLTANRIDTMLVMKVKYNIDFSPAIDVDWISIEPATLSMEGATRGEDGLVEAELKVNVKENPSYTYRVSHITNDSGSAPSVSTITQSPFGFKEFEGYSYKTIYYGASEWFAENLRAKFGQEEGNTVNEHGYGTNSNPNYFWAEQDGELLYSIEGMLYSDKMQGKSICPEGWHIATREDWQEVFSLGKTSSPKQFIKKILGGSDDYSFGGNYGKWHAGSYWLEMGLCTLFQDGAIINNDEASIEQRSADQEHYPSMRFRHIRCVRGPVAPIVQTLPVINQTTTSAELRVGALNGPEMANVFHLKYYDKHSKITKVIFKYGPAENNLSSSISTNGGNLSVELTGLTPGTVYYYQPIVEYEGGKEPVYGEVMSFKTHDGKLEYQGETYYTTVFNGVEWMTRNLEAENLNDGTPIPNVKETSAWSFTTEPAQCTFRNENSTLDTYGRYYNKYAINTNKICPEGWRLPTTDDFSSNWNGQEFGFFDYFCLADLNYYVNPVFGNNLSGFSALPSGMRPAEEDSYRGRWEDYRLKGYDFYTWVTYLFGTPEIGVLHIQNQMGTYENVSTYGYGVTNNTGCPVRCVREKQ